MGSAVLQKMLLCCNFQRHLLPCSRNICISPYVKGTVFSLCPAFPIQQDLHGLSERGICPLVAFLLFFSLDPKAKK